jgi:hypothetical protein
MKLQAVTICVHGADLLSCSLPNRHQFDRWLIVTVPQDAETIALCRSNGLEFLLSGVLRPDGADLYEDDKLARVTDEALALLEPDGWVILLSERVLLPRIFRAQMSASKLDSACEYRPAGVRHCPNHLAFERLAAVEPWRAMPTAALDEEPPFRMFVRSEASAPARIEQLAVTALLIGDGGSPSASASRGSDSRQALLDWLAARGQGKTVLVAGYYPGLDLERLAGSFRAVYLQDLHRLCQSDPAVSIESGQDGLRRVWATEMERLAPSIEAHVHELPSSDDGNPAGEKIEVLYLPGEVQAETALQSLAMWRHVLHADAIVCGDLHGMAHWQEATSTIALLFGRPNVEPAGFWWAAVRGTPLGRIVDSAAQRNASGSEVIRLAADNATDEEILLSLHSLRGQWRDAIHVVGSPPNPVLALQCALLGGDWRTGCETAAPRITISAGTLAFGKIDLAQTVSDVDASLDEVSSFRSVLQRMGLARRRGSFVRYQGDPKGWTKKNRIARHRMAANVHCALLPAILTPSDSTVATIVDPTTLPIFQAQWPRWLFEATPVVIAYVGIDKKELDWALESRSARCIEIEPSVAASPARTLRRIASCTKTTRLILLPAGAQPLPGATLFAAQDLSAPIVLHSSVEVQPVAGMMSLPEGREPLAACMSLAVARDICRARVVKHKGGIGALLHRALRAGQAHWSTCNLAREGWLLEAGPLRGAR